MKARLPHTIQRMRNQSFSNATNRKNTVRKNPMPRRARESMSATPNANITWSGTKIAISQSVFRTAGHTCWSCSKRNR